MSSVYRSRVLGPSGETLAILSTWSDGALVAAARPELTVQNGEWHGRDADSAPEPTHASHEAFLAEVAS